MMNIKLYNTRSPKNKLSKTLNLVADITGESNINVGEHNTQFILSKGHLNGVKGSNYLFCEDTGKYYFIEDYDIQNQTVIITCKIDVLMSYRTQILSNTCTISKNENIANSYLYDNGYQLKSYNIVSTIPFPHGLTTDSIILMTIG